MVRNPIQLKTNNCPMAKSDATPPGDRRRQLGHPRRRGDECHARWVGARRRHGPAEPGASGCSGKAASRGRRHPGLHQGASGVASSRPGMLSFLTFFPRFSLWGRASTPTGCSPRVSGRLLSRRLGTPFGEFRYLSSSKNSCCRNTTTSASLPSTAMLRSQASGLPTCQRVRVSLPSSSWGRAGAPAGYSPRDSG